MFCYALISVLVLTFLQVVSYGIIVTGVNDGQSEKRTRMLLIRFIL